MLFSDRSSFSESKGAWALMHGDVLVQIKDLVAIDDFGLRKYLVHEDASFVLERLGRSLTFSFEVWEDRLHPVDPCQAGWFEKIKAERLAASWQQPVPSKPGPRF